MQCQDPATCMERSNHYKVHQQQNLKIAELILEKFRTFLSDHEAEIAFSLHLEKRRLQRAVSKNDILTVLREGWPIEINKESNGNVSILLLYFLGPNYRPLHVSCAFEPRRPRSCTIKTTYDPRSELRKWDQSYQTRICFCK